MNDFKLRKHPELKIDGFTVLDGTVTFYSLVKAAMQRHDAREVLDFGAGRGASFHDDPSVYRRSLRDLRTTGATVTACDIDAAVMSHPCSHRQIVIEQGKPLPFDDQSFDLIVTDHTFEHIEHPVELAKELIRVLKPCGYICARTPNRYGYVSVGAGLVPNRMHGSALRRVQSDRAEQDIFPTFYRLNSVSEVRKAFAGCEVMHYHDSAEPAYYFGSALLYKMLLKLHRLLPDAMATSVCFFIRKPA
jgi:SAM-dependent methyltransferase